MISAKALYSVRPLAKAINGRGVAVESMVHTPLETMSNATTVIVDEEKNVVDVPSTVEITNNSSVGILPNQHHMVLDNVVEEGARAVRTQLRLCRNVVAPLHEELVESVRGLLEEKFNPALAGFSVIEERYPELTTEGSFLALIEEYAKTNIAEVEATLQFGERSTEQLRELMHTGFKTTDEAIDLFLASKGDGWLAEVWNDFYNGAENRAFKGIMTTLQSESDVSGVEKAIAVHLLARGLLENPAEESGLSLNQYNAVLRDIRNSTGSFIYTRLSAANQSRAADLIIRRVQGNIVTVDGVLFDKWINAGGDVDVLFGLAVSKLKLYSIKDLDTNRERLFKAWVDYVKLANATNTSNKYQAIRSTLASAFAKQLEAEAGEAANYGAERNIKEIYTLFVNEMRKLSDDELQDINDAVLKLLCASRFKDTDAYKLMSRIAFHCKDDPTLSTREAATIATIEYITDWTYSQIRVTDMRS